jgi:hypothetical protein
LPHLHQLTQPTEPGRGTNQWVSPILSYNWTYSFFRFNYIFGSIDRRAAVGGAPRVAAGTTSGDYDMLGTRFMVDFNDNSDLKHALPEDF